MKAGKEGKSKESWEKQCLPGVLQRSASFSFSLAAPYDSGGKLLSTERLLAQYGSVIAFKSQSTSPSEPIMGRLRDEQTNRMAYAATLRRLIDGCAKGAAVVASLADQLAREIGVVQQLVGAKSSVPKVRREKICGLEAGPWAGPEGQSSMCPTPPTPSSP